MTGNQGHVMESEYWDLRKILIETNKIERIVLKAGFFKLPLALARGQRKLNTGFSRIFWAKARAFNAQNPQLKLGAISKRFLYKELRLS